MGAATSRSRIVIDAAGNGDADALAGEPGMRAQKRLQPATEIADEHVRAGRGRHALVGDHAPVGIRNRDRRQGGTDIDAENPRTLDVEIEQPRLPPAKRLPGLAFGDPALLDQLVGDERHRAPLQPGLRRQVGARDRLSRTNQPKEQVPVDVTDRLARSRRICPHRVAHASL